MSGQDGASTTPQSAQPSGDFERVGTLTRLSDGREFPLGFGSLRVGRQRRADIVLTDKTVSRHHADVCYESGRYIVYDHSANGTWVNDAVVGVALNLREGDAVKFGSVAFRFGVKKVPKHAAARRDAEAPPRIPRWPTRLMRGGKSGKEGHRGLFRWVVLAIVIGVLGAAAALIFFLFPELAARALP
jgi:hypothetical protein